MELTDALFVLIDTETTGKDPSTCEVLEIAAQHRDVLGNSFARFQTLVRPTVHITEDVEGIHFIGDVDVADAPPPALAVAALRRFVPPDAICVAHNASFDATVLRDALGDRRWLCTERLAHHLDPDSPNFKLSTLRIRYGHKNVDTEGFSSHRAIADVLVLAPIFDTLLSRYLTTAQYDREGDMVQQLLDFTAAPYEVKTMLFGKHAGTPITKLPESYLEWGVSAKGLDDRDMLYTFRQELGRREGRMVLR